jgi:GNAT superfamily N-acetyltransferase
MKYRIINKILSLLGVRFLEVVYFAPDFVPSPPGFEARVITAAELRELIERQVLVYQDEDINRVDNGVAICIAAFFEGELAGVCWYARRAYRHTTGFLAHIGNDYLCGYGLRIMPAYQGRGVHGVLVGKALDWMRLNDKKRLLLAINFDNIASRNSAIKLGFQKQGYSFYHPWLKGFPAMRQYYMIDAA